MLKNSDRPPLNISEWARHFLPPENPKEMVETCSRISKNRCLFRQLFRSLLWRLLPHKSVMSACPLQRSAAHTSELQSLMTISNADFCFNKTQQPNDQTHYY